MSSLLKRKGHWYLQWRQDGRTLQRSTRIAVADDPAGRIARQIQRDHDTAHARQSAGLDEPAAPIRPAVEAWLRTLAATGERYQRNARARLARWCAWLDRRGVAALDEITPELIGDWIAERRSAGASDSTLVMEVGQLAGVADLASRGRRVRPIRTDLWPRPRRRQTRRPDRIGAYTQAEVESLIEYFRGRPTAARWYAPIMLLAHLGCRWGELREMLVADLRLDGRPPMVRIESRKTAKSASTQYRWVEIHPRIQPLLEGLTHGKAPADRVVELPSPQDAAVVIGRACRVLGIQYRRIHGLRHYWITTMLAHGVPLSAVMAMAGHRNLGTTQRYLTVDHRQTGWVSSAFPSDQQAGPATDALPGDPASAPAEKKSSGRKKARKSTVKAGLLGGHPAAGGPREARPVAQIRAKAGRSGR